MIVAHVAAVVFGAVLTMAVLISALETVVLPRNGFTRIARCVFSLADRVLVHRWRNEAMRTNLRALYAPVALVSLPLVWMLSVTIGFSFIFWGISRDSPQRAFEVSGSSLFTLGFAEPEGTARIWLTFVEATIGLGLVALLISYLPTIYAAHHNREKGISVLRPFAGTPPSPVDMLGNLQRLGSLDNPELWRTAATWMLELGQTHTAFPALSYFPESTPDQSWVASLGTLLDGATLFLSASDYSTEQDATDEIKGPMMALAYGTPTLVDIGRAAGLPIPPAARLMELVARTGEPAPGISIRREEYLAALDRLHPLLQVPEDQREGCWRRFAWVRSGYDAALCGMAGLTLAPAAEWTTDRPAVVGRPRILRSQPIAIEWPPGAAVTAPDGPAAAGPPPAGPPATGG
ncbi:MAG: hypothetical protein ACLQPH_13330 [Acidimicrobiales bacterium]